MNISINGESKIITDSISINDLLREFNVEAPDTVSVQLNGNFVDRKSFTSTFLKNNDEIDFLYFMGGGR
ncbi:MAG TPA: sulfur carrier protein ThiS [Chitinispirillaceae bacterium]|nr:sulfur carrier protein ThiS [Chitinispirillaceae bacterium]